MNDIYDHQAYATSWANLPTTGSRNSETRRNWSPRFEHTPEDKDIIVMAILPIGAFPMGGYPIEGCPLGVECTLRFCGYEYPISFFEKQNEVLVPQGNSKCYPCCPGKSTHLRRAVRPTEGPRVPQQGSSPSPQVDNSIWGRKEQTGRGLGGHEAGPSSKLRVDEKSIKTSGVAGLVSLSSW